MALSEAAIGGIISAAGSAAGAGVSAIATSNLNKKNREWQEQQSAVQRAWNESMADKQNAWNYEMWLKEQEYNNPANQVQRLRDAGLNPLFYGLDGNSVNQAQPAAQPLGYERASQFNVANPVSAGIDAAIQVAQISNIQANTAKQKEETLTEVQRRERLQADIVLAKQELNNKLASEGLDIAKRKEIEKQLSWFDRINEATIAEKEANAKLSSAQKKRIEELLEGEKLYQAKSIEDFDKRWAKIQAEISKISKENDILDQDLENYALNHASNGLFGTGLSGQNIIRFLLGLGGNVSNSSSRDMPADVEQLIREGQ